MLKTMSRFNLNNKQGRNNAIERFEFLLGNKALIELKDVKKTRTNTQNAALWLYFTQCADALNEIGHSLTINCVDGEVLELNWDKDSFKEHIWKPLQLSAYKTDSTTKLTTDQITPIYDTINLWLSEKGVSVTFPNRFDMYLEVYK